jgi:peptidoglycan/LPS O-acetylase OafA/YrhL
MKFFRGDMGWFFMDIGHATTPSPGASSASPRRHDLDALRAFAMLLGILLHGAMAFMPFPWIVQDPQKSPAAGLIVAMIHGFRMPLFFVMSGFFTAMLWQKRGAGAMLRQRFMRVLLPCMLGLVTILPAGEWVAARSREAVARQDKGQGTQASENPWLAAVSKAVAAGDAGQLAELLAQEDEAEGPRPPLVDPVSKSPLLTTAAVLGHVDVARELIDHGADVNGRDQGGRTAMHAAAFMGKAEVVELLLARGATPLPKGPVGDTPIDSSRVDAATTTMLAGVLRLPAPDMEEVEAGRKRVRQMIATATGTEPDTAEEDEPQRAKGNDDEEARRPGLAGLRQAYTAWLTSERFVVPLPPRWMPQSLFMGPIFGHLWFLWFLCWLVVGFTIFAGLASMLKLPTPPRWLVVSPAVLLWLVPLTAIPQLFMGVFGPNVGPDTSLSLLPQPHLLVYYGIFFGYGSLLFFVGDPENRVGRRWWLLLPLAVLACFPAAAASMGNPVATAVPQVLFAWLMSFGLIGLFRAMLRSENTVVRYISDSAYWLYIAHIPVLVAFQTWARPWPWPPLLKLFAECVLATAVLLVSYQLFVRHTPIGWLLNGRRGRARRPELEAASAAALSSPTMSPPDVA